MTEKVQVEIEETYTVITNKTPSSETFSSTESLDVPEINEGEFPMSVKKADLTIEIGGRLSHQYQGTNYGLKVTIKDVSERGLEDYAERLSNFAREREEEMVQKSDEMLHHLLGLDSKR
jgi:hypothetical protein